MFLSYIAAERGLSGCQVATDQTRALRQTTTLELKVSSTSTTNMSAVPPRSWRVTL